MRKYILFLSLFFVVNATAQEQKQSYRHEAQLTAGMNSYCALEIEPSYSFMFHKYIGIVGGVRAVAEVVDDLRYPIVSPKPYDWRISRRRTVSTVLLRPALRLRFPILAEDIFFAVEPGLLLNLIPNEEIEFAYKNMVTIEPPLRYKSVRNKDGEVCSYEVKGYFSLHFDRWSVIAGYGLSNYDTYSGRRNIVIEGDPLNDHLPRHHTLSHRGFIGVGYLF